MKGMTKGPEYACKLQQGGIVHDDDGSDRISELADDILISILCRLPFREATATSLLSSRWRYLHTCVTHLDFPPYKPKVQSSDLPDIQRQRFENHVNMINGVLDSYRGGVTLKGLRLCMYRMKMKGCNYTKKWVQFAFTKEVETMDITLTQVPNWYSHFKSNEIPSFGLSELMMMMTNKSMVLPSIKCLKQLTLLGVKVADQDFDILISNFLALESVSIRDTFRLKRATIVGHPNLMHVEVPCDSLEIRNVANLVSLRLSCLSSGGTIEMENVPKLTEFYSCESEGSLQHLTLYSQIPSDIRHQLQAIHLQSYDTYNLFDQWPTSIQFVNVRHLQLEVESMRDYSGVDRFFRLIAACSSLEKLKIKLSWRSYSASLIKFGERSHPYYSNDKKLSPKLKVLEMEGYAGTSSEFRLAAFLTHYAMNLERVVIVVACDADDRIRRRSLARAQEDFRLITPPSVHLQFI